MESLQKLQMIEEIKRIERELYIMRSKLASVNAMEYDDAKIESPDEINTTKTLKDSFAKLIKNIGEHSSGGNSVDDIYYERNR